MDAAACWMIDTNQPWYCHPVPRGRQSELLAKGDALSNGRMDMVKFAVVGCGNIGTQHLNVLGARDGSCGVALCDIDPAKRRKYSELYESSSRVRVD